jgi:hypothetical protein
VSRRLKIFESLRRLVHTILRSLIPLRLLLLFHHESQVKGSSRSRLKENDQTTFTAAAQEPAGIRAAAEPRHRRRIPARHKHFARFALFSWGILICRAECRGLKRISCKVIYKIASRRLGSSSLHARLWSFNSFS